MNHEVMEQMPDEPFTGPSDWFRYRCRSCSYADWVEDIVVAAFPPVKPEGFPAIVCPNCGKSFRCDTAEPVIRSLQHPDHIN